MPSPTCRTVPTSARSLSTSYSSMRCLRIDVISSGRSFTASPSALGVWWVPRNLLGGRELAAEPLQAAAHARVETVRADLQHDPADQVGVDGASRLDRAAGRARDLAEQLLGLVVTELDRGRQLRMDDAFVLGDQALELLADLRQPVGAALVDEHEQEVAHQLVAASEHVLERGRARARVDARVAQELAQLGHLGLGRDELPELLAYGLEAPLAERGLEDRVRVDAVDHAHSAPLQDGEVELADRFLDQ